MQAFLHTERKWDMVNEKDKELKQLVFNSSSYANFMWEQTFFFFITMWDRIFMHYKYICGACICGNEEHMHIRNNISMYLCLYMYTSKYLHTHAQKYKMWYFCVFMCIINDCIVDLSELVHLYIQVDNLS